MWETHITLEDSWNVPSSFDVDQRILGQMWWRMFFVHIGTCTAEIPSQRLQHETSEPSGWNKKTTATFGFTPSITSIRYQQNIAQQSTKKPGVLRSDSQPLPGFSAQKPLEPPAASNITGVTQVSTMIRMAKKQSKLNLGRNRLLHVALSHPRYKNYDTWGR